MKRLVILPEVLFTSHRNQITVYASSTKNYFKRYGSKKRKSGRFDLSNILPDIE